MQNNPVKQLLRVLFTMAIVILSLQIVESLPYNVSIQYITNESKTTGQGTLFNTSGGSVTTLTLNGTTQDVRWKAFVGNITGQLSLDDATGSTIFNWDITTVTGEVYATRAAASINWTYINCSYTNATEQENWLMNHTNADDNISATFRQQSHSSFFVGTIVISTNSCPSLRTYINDTIQNVDFEEVVLYDGGPNWFFNRSNSTGFKNIVYATIIEQNVKGFDSETYDFQMIVPENGAESWQSATGYYFYAELS